MFLFTSTGADNGVISLIEDDLGRPLHYFSCQLHANELPLRHLIEKRIAKPSGPRGFAGQFGKDLANCEHMPIVDYNFVASEELIVDKEVTASLSTDQKYMFDMYQAVKNGICSQSLAARDPGPINHARWLTTANRILRLYVATEKPFEGLISVVNYIMNVYVPMWFNIKCKWSCINGPIHVAETLRRVSGLKDSTQKVVLPVIQRNAYFAHPENVLLSMLQEKNGKTRELAWTRIQEARNRQTEEGKKGKSTLKKKPKKGTRSEAAKSTVRRFVIPPLKSDAKKYSELFDWKAKYVYEPPFTRKYSDDDITRFISCKSKVEEDYSILRKIPCHTQAVERAIKNLTDVCLKHTNPDHRDGAIRAKMISRAQNPIVRKTRRKTEQLTSQQ